MVIIHPTSSSDEVNVALPESRDGNVFYCAKTDNRFRLFCVTLASYIHKGSQYVCVYRDLSVQWRR